MISPLRAVSWYFVFPYLLEVIMTFLNSRQSKGYRTEKVGDRIVVYLPNQNPWLQVGFLAIWLMFWLLGWRGAVSRQVGSKNDVVFLVWLVVWLGGWLATAVGFFWQLAGERVLEIDRYALRIRWELFGLNWTKAYVASDMRNLQVMTYGNQSTGLWSWSKPTISFKYGHRTVHLGAGLNGQYARQIVDMICQNPAYKCYQRC